MSYCKARLLSGRGQDVKYKVIEGNIEAQWGEAKFIIPSFIINEIAEKFFVDIDKWYDLGANMTDIKKGGLGEFLVKVSKNKLTPRHASAIAAILVNENYILAQGTRHILLKKNTVIDKVNNKI